VKRRQNNRIYIDTFQKNITLDSRNWEPGPGNKNEIEICDTFKLPKTKNKHFLRVSSLKKHQKCNM